jgi:hypothetical protein
MRTGDGAGQLESPGGSSKRQARVLDEPGAGRAAQAHNRR